jgi:hypothetical protein
MLGRSRSTRRASRAIPAAIGSALAIGAACARDHIDSSQRAARSISRQRIDQVGRRLAADDMAGRYYASPEADSTVAYLMGQLRGAGLARTEHAETLFGPRPAMFVHAFGVTLLRLGALTHLMAQRANQERSADLGHDFVPLVFSRVEGVQGEIVRLRTDPLAAILPASEAPLAGRIVLVPAEAWSSGSPPDDSMLYRAARALETRGAIAVLFAGDAALLHLPSATFPNHLAPEERTAAGSVRGSTANLSPDRISQAAQAQAWLAAPQPTLPSLVVRDGWASWLRDGDRVALLAQLQPEVSLAQNLLVGFRGRSRPEEVVVVGAHYDHTGINADGDVLNGADDNASGVAALHEVARALVPVRGRLERSVLLAFFSAGREGLQGSESLLRDLGRLVGGDARPVAMLSLRAVGRNGARPLLLVGGAERSDLAAVLERYDTHEALLGPPLGLQRAAEESTRVGRLEVVPSRGSDHLTFARGGVPSLLLTCGLDPLLYDRPEDDWRHVDADKVTRVARLAFRACLDLATDLRPTAATASAGPR